uniref:Uncharacterized protein n=1 Tax=Rhizophora mucronata TaxID=61149 RepID=A0A2P2NFU4_RHIMU
MLKKNSYFTCIWSSVYCKVSNHFFFPSLISDSSSCDSLFCSSFL